MIWWIIPIVIVVLGLLIWIKDSVKGNGLYFAAGSLGFVGFLISILVAISFIAGHYI